MADAQTQKFRETYKRLRESVLEPTRREIKAELKTWERGKRWKPHRGDDVTVPVPVQRTRVRIKRLESVEDKIARNPRDFPGGLTEENLLRVRDLVGARIILYFVTDIPLIDRELHRCEEIDLVPGHLPKAYLPRDLATQLGLDMPREDKSSGYASVHYRCTLQGSKTVPFELQVRTLAEDVWGEIEHILGYKPGKRTALPVTREFKILSKQLGAIDEQFALLYHRQRVHREQVMVTPDDPPNAENLPKVLSELGMIVSQDEINGLLKVLASRGITSIGELQLRARPERIHAISKVWQKVVGRVPQTFDIVAVLGTIRADDTPREVRSKAHEWAIVAQAWSTRLSDDDAYEQYDDDSVRR